LSASEQFSSTQKGPETMLQKMNPFSRKRGGKTRRNKNKNKNKRHSKRKNKNKRHSRRKNKRHPKRRTRK